MVLSIPLLIGVSAMDQIIHFKELGCHSVHITSRFRSFFHVYSSLLQFGLEPIPFLDQLMETYREVIFAGDGERKQGNYLKSWLLSSHVAANEVNSMFTGVEKSRKKKSKEERKQEAE